MLQVNNLSMQFGGRTLFKNVNVSFKKGECYGIIGANGAGKSTLLKIISGELEPTSGSITMDEKERMSVLKQDHNAYNDRTVLETVLLGNPRLIAIRDQKDALYNKEDFTDEDGILAGELENEYAELDGWVAEAKACELLLSIGIKEELHNELMGKIDSKIKVKVLLAQAVFGNPDILVLDEPTNNLDSKTAIWLEDFLADFENTILIVSHDRYFLNKVCTSILDVDFGEINCFVGNYDFWYESSQLLQRQMKDGNTKKETQIEELQAFIARFSANASKSKQATSRKKLLEKITLDDIKPSSRRYPYIDFKFEGDIGRDVLEVSELSKEGAFKNLSFFLNKGDKMAVIASSTQTITTLFKVLMGEVAADSGLYKFGITIKPMYFPTNLVEYEGVSDSLIDQLRPYSPDQLISTIRGFLGRMLFSGEEAMKNVNVLSGGEKVRLKFTQMMMKPGNLGIFDDPTNHLDLESIEALNKGLVSFKGPLIFSSHDHEFLSTLANRILIINDDGTYVDLHMTYDEYLKEQESK